MTATDRLMHDRLAAGLDPLTGHPRQTCHPSVDAADGGCVCVGCGRPVRLSPAGDWIYAEAQS